LNTEQAAQEESPLTGPDAYDGFQEHKTTDLKAPHISNVVVAIGSPSQLKFTMIAAQPVHARSFDT